MSSVHFNSGIYKITCEPTNKIYIGSAKDLRIRWKTHINELNRNGHVNNYLQYSWNKYGEKSFSFDIIEYVEIDNLLDREQFWLDVYKPFASDKNGFNICKFAGSTLGKKHSKETKEKIRKVQLGRKMAETTRDSLKKAHIGRKNSEETKMKMSESQIITLSKRNNLLFTEEDIIEIKMRILNLEKLRDIAKDYNVHESQISQIKNGRRWKHVLPELDLSLINLKAISKRNRNQ